MASEEVRVQHSWRNGVNSGSAHDDARRGESTANSIYPRPGVRAKRRTRAEDPRGGKTWIPRS